MAGYVPHSMLYLVLFATLPVGMALGALMTSMSGVRLVARPRRTRTGGRHRARP